MTNVLDLAGVVGDGTHDDTAGLQAALDSGASTVYLPAPPAAYLISGTLTIHSGQTLKADRNAVIRLADHAHAHMLTNADHEEGNERITVSGGIWDGNNAHQMCEFHKDYSTLKLPYDPASYLGFLMQFNRVTDLRVAHVTYKDPESFGLQVGNLRRFTIEDITFDYNLLRGNMDGIHVHGNCHEGRLVNLKGATNDDLVALNADDADRIEISHGPITDILVDGIWSTDGYTAVRLLSAGSPIQRVRIANVFGTYRYNVVSFTNWGLHPDRSGIFDDVSIQGVFCSRSARTVDAGTNSHWVAAVRIDERSVVSNLTIRDYHRTEAVRPTNDIHIQKGAVVENLMLSDSTLVNQCGAPIKMLNNLGTIRRLALANVYAKAGTPDSGGCIVSNDGTIGSVSHTGVAADGFELGITPETPEE